MKWLTIERFAVCVGLLLVLSVIAGLAFGEETVESGLVDWDCTAESEYKPEKSRTYDPNDLYQTIKYIDNGDPDIYYDLVVQMDGYDIIDIATGKALLDAQALIDELVQQVPFDTYKSLWNVTIQILQSNDSGVDLGGPDCTDSTDIKDTVLDSGWNSCSRLSKVDKDAVEFFALLADDVDCVYVVMNSLRYGGRAEWQSFGVNNLVGIGQGSMHPSWSDYLIIHELGHAFCVPPFYVADEYFTEGTTYMGNETDRINISIKDCPQQSTEDVKWAPDWDGIMWNGMLHGCWEGARFFEFGLFRPSEDSIMKSLGGEFNGPSAEAMIACFYKDMPVIIDSTPDQILTEHESAAVQVAAPSCEATWELDGVVVSQGPVETHSSLDITTLGLGPGIYILDVTVVDEYDGIRDPDIRADLTDIRTWTIDIDAVSDAEERDEFVWPEVTAVVEGFELFTVDGRKLKPSADPPYGVLFQKHVASGRVRKVVVLAK